MSANSTPETLRMPYHYHESRFAYYYDCLASCNLNILRFKVLEIASRYITTWCTCEEEKITIHYHYYSYE